MRNLTALGMLATPLALLLCATPVTAAPTVKGLVGKLKQGIGAKNDGAVRESLEGLIDLGGADAVSSILKLIPKMGAASDTNYWQLINSAAGFRDAQALMTLGDFIVKKKKAPFARDLLFGLENNGSHHVVVALEKVLRKGTYDMQLMAVDQLAMVASTAGVDALIAALKKEGDKGDPQLRRRIMSSLSTLTKENMGDALNWIGWWEANRGKGLPESEDHMSGGGSSSVPPMNSDRGKQLESVRKNPDRIIVISSRIPADAAKDANRDYNYDHMEQILTKMKIPHKVVKKKDFEKDPQKYLKKAWTILINCNNIQTQCICPECARLLALRAKNGGSLGPKKNRLYTCPVCPQGHDRVNYRMKEPTIMQIKKWVEQGGYLFTEDWGVVEVIEVAWPKLVTSNSHSKPDGAGNAKKSVNLVAEITVPIKPGRGMTSVPLLRGVFTRRRPPARAPKADDDDGDGGSTRTRDLSPRENPTVTVHHKWKIDDESPSIRIQNKSAVSVLLRSQELGEVAEGDDTVAVNFRVGKGKPRGAKKRRKGPVTGSGPEITGKSRAKGSWAEVQPGGSVLHCISHFGKQQTSASDTYVLQNLILNFVMESNRNHGG